MPSKSSRSVTLVLTILVAGSVLGYSYFYPSHQTSKGSSKGIHLKDGDSFVMGNEEFRLYAMDAPELHQVCKTSLGKDWPCGRESKKALSKFIAGKKLSCHKLKRDIYHRFLATCFAGGKEINRWMVRNGWAVTYRSSRKYLSEQSKAKKEKLGIWKGTFIRPEVWRASHKWKKRTHKKTR